MLTKQVKISQIYINKTWKYLVPATKIYGDLFKVRMENLYKLAAGYGDECYPRKVGKSIFLVVDKLYIPDKYNHTMTWLRNQDYYITDYPFDNIETGRMQMIVLKFPDEFSEAFDDFLKGRYSRMYTEKEIEKFYRVGDNTRTGVIDILTRTSTAKREFLPKLKASFGDNINVTDEDLKFAEYDFPPQPQLEIFNYEPIKEERDYESKNDQ